MRGGSLLPDAQVALRECAIFHRHSAAAPPTSVVGQSESEAPALPIACPRMPGSVLTECRASDC